MSGNSKHRVGRSRSPSDDYSKRSLLAKVEKSELTKIRVAIKRSNMIGPSSSSTLDRTIEDPTKICPLVHVRKGLGPRIPIFSKGIKVNQDFSEDRQVFTSRRSRSRSRSISCGYRCRSRSRRSRTRDSPGRSKRRRGRSKYKSRDRSRSFEYKGKKYRSLSRSKSRSSSKHRRDCIMYSRSPERGRRKSLSRSKSRSSSKHRRDRIMYSRSPERGRRKSARSRSITPLKPGEYRPGHPDLALRSKARKSRSRSRSLRRDNMPSTSRGSRDREFKDKSGRSNSPNGERYRKGIHRSHSNMLGMDYGFYDGFAPMPMHPQFRGRFPMVDPNFFPRMYPPMLMPRMPMMPRMPYRPRWPIYNSEQENAKITAELKIENNKQPIITEPAEPEAETKKDETVFSAVSSSKSEEGEDGEKS